MAFALQPNGSEAGGVRRILNGLPVEIEVLEEREGQVQTKAGLRPSKTLVLKARVLAGDG